MIWQFAREKTHEVLIDVAYSLRVPQAGPQFYNLACEIEELK